MTRTPETSEPDSVTGAHSPLATSLPAAGAQLVALVGMVVLPWTEISGAAARGNRVAELLLTMPSIAGLPPIGKAVSLAWYLGVLAMLAVLALLIFRPGARRLLLTASAIGMVTALLLGCATFKAGLGSVGVGPVVAMVGAAGGFAWICFRPFHRPAARDHGGRKLR